MSSKSITEQPDAPPSWVQEVAPSELRADEPSVARWIGMIGWTVLAMGLVIWFVLNILRWTVTIGPFAFGTGGAILLCYAALVGILYHAATDGDTQVRRSYGVLGYILLAAAVTVLVVPVEGAFGQLFMPWSVLALIVAFLFLLPFVHLETDSTWRERTIDALGLVGAILALVGLVVGNFSSAFLIPYGLACAVLGLPYLWAFIASRGSEDTVAYRAGVGMALAGFLAVLFALGRWLIPWISYFLGYTAAPSDGYFGNAGLLVVLTGLLYLGTALGLCSDNRFVVMTRRELAGFFYSPMAYVVLFGFFGIATLLHWNFTYQVLRMAQRGQSVPEPIILPYMFNILAVFFQMLAVPLLTMRLFSEEKRSGTYEVLMTAPVSEFAVVMSKFVAVLIVFIAVWIPYGLYLLSLRVEGGQAFDYRPVESFFLALLFSGVGLLAMGLFFSSLTRNQIAAGVLTMGGMAAAFSMYLFRGSDNSVTSAVLQQVCFIDLWRATLDGRVPIGALVLQASIGVFFLFLTVKLLEARKWS